MAETTDFLPRKQVPAYLRSRGINLSYRTLMRMAFEETGPPYSTFGREAVYRREELDTWIEDRMRKNRRAVAL